MGFVQKIKPPQKLRLQKYSILQQNKQNKTEEKTHQQKGTGSRDVWGVCYGFQAGTYFVPKLKPLLFEIEIKIFISPLSHVNRLNITTKYYANRTALRSSCESQSTNPHAPSENVLGQMAFFSRTSTELPEQAEFGGVNTASTSNENVRSSRNTTRLATYLLVQEGTVPCAQDTVVLRPLVLNLRKLLENRLYRIFLLHYLVNRIITWNEVKDKHIKTTKGRHNNTPARKILRRYEPDWYRVLQAAAVAVMVMVAVFLSKQLPILLLEYIDLQ